MKAPLSSVIKVIRQGINTSVNGRIVNRMDRIPIPLPMGELTKACLQTVNSSMPRRHQQRGGSLPTCKGSPVSNQDSVKSWTDCIGTVTATKGTKYVGQWKAVFILNQAYLGC